MALAKELFNHVTLEMLRYPCFRLKRTGKSSIWAWTFIRNYSFPSKRNRICFSIITALGGVRLGWSFVNSKRLVPTLLAQTVKNLPAIQETQVWYLGRENTLKKGMATHSSILACRIPWTEEPGGLQSVGSQRVWHDWATNTSHTILFKTHFYLSSLATPGLSCPEIQVPDISNFFCQQIRPLSCHQKNFAPQIAWIQPDKIPESFTLPSG